MTKEAIDPNVTPYLKEGGTIRKKIELPDIRKDKVLAPMAVVLALIACQVLENLPDIYPEDVSTPELPPAEVITFTREEVLLSKVSYETIEKVVDRDLIGLNVDVLSFIPAVSSNSRGEEFIFAQGYMPGTEHFNILVAIDREGIKYVKGLAHDEEEPNVFYAFTSSEEDGNLLVNNEGALMRRNLETGDIDYFLDGEWEALIIPEDETDDIKNTFGTAGLASMVLPTPPPEELDIEVDSTEPTNQQEIIAILEEIKNNFGITIPSEVSDEYSRKKYFPRNSAGVREQSEVAPNALLTLDEVNIVKDVLGIIPGVENLFQLIIPNRNNNPGAIPGGSYLGYQWPYFLNYGEYESFPDQQLLSDQAAIELKIPENVSMNDPLPWVSEDYSNAVLPAKYQLSLESAGIEASTYIEIPWTTYGERLKQAIAHESGHALIDKIRLASTQSIEEYWNSQAFTMAMFNTWDIDNPLFVGFAEVNGWKLIPYADYVNQFGPEMVEVLDINPETGSKLIWDRDPEVWGEIDNRVVRLTPYASYGPIPEALCEYWMTFLLYPDLLTDEELAFFGNIQRGLENDPEAFIQAISGNGFIPPASTIE